MSAIKTSTLTLWLSVENNSSFVRGKTRVRAQIEREILTRHAAKPTRAWEYELTFSYADDDEPDRQVFALLDEMSAAADLRHCFIEADVRDPATDRSW